MNNKQRFIHLFFKTAKIFFPYLYLINLSTNLEIGIKNLSQNKTCFNFGEELFCKNLFAADANKPIESIYLIIKNYCDRY